MSTSLRRSGWAVVLGVVVLMVPLIAAVNAWHLGWMPFGDDGVVVAQSWGSLGTSPPLVGMPSSVTAASGSAQALYHPGPIQLWMMALPVRMLAPSTSGVLLGAALFTVAGIGVLLLVAWRRGGRWMFVPTTVAAAWILHAVGAQFIREPVNDSAALFAMVGYCAAAWAVLDRDRWFAPVAVVAGSIAVQAQVSFAIPVLAVAAAVTVARIRLRVRSRSPRSTGRDRSRHRVLIVSALALVVCWSGPAVDQLCGSGNAWALIRDSRGIASVGPGWGWNRLIDSLAFPPSWAIGGIRGHGGVLADGTPVYHSTAIEYLTAAMFTVCFVLAVLWCRHRSSSRLQALAVVAIALLVGTFVAASLMPDDPIGLIAHVKIWRVTGFFAWLVPLLTASEAVGELVEGHGESWVRRFAHGLPILGLLAVCFPLGSLLARSSPRYDLSSSGYGAVDRFVRAAAPLCRGSAGPIVLEYHGLGESLTAPGVVAGLQLHGCKVHVRSPLAETLSGGWFTATGEETLTLMVSNAADPPGGFRRLSSYDPARRSGRYRDFDRVFEIVQSDEPVYLYVRGD